MSADRLFEPGEVPKAGCPAELSREGLAMYNRTTHNIASQVHDSVSRFRIEKCATMLH
jgi:hypothetical protein